MKVGWSGHDLAPAHAGLSRIAASVAAGGRWEAVRFTPGLVADGAAAAAQVYTKGSAGSSSGASAVARHSPDLQRLVTGKMDERTSFLDRARSRWGPRS
jgi:hypothetical protein